MTAPVAAAVAVKVLNWGHMLNQRGRVNKLFTFEFKMKMCCFDSDEATVKCFDSVCSLVFPDHFKQAVVQPPIK